MLTLVIVMFAIMALTAYGFTFVCNNPDWCSSVEVTAINNFRERIEYLITVPFTFIGNLVSAKFNAVKLWVNTKLGNFLKRSEKSDNLEV